MLCPPSNSGFVPIAEFSYANLLVIAAVISIPIFQSLGISPPPGLKNAGKDLLFLALAGAGDSLVLTCEL
jgi:hypothetical protein